MAKDVLYLPKLMEDGKTDSCETLQTLGLHIVDDKATQAYTVLRPNGWKIHNVKVQQTLNSQSGEVVLYIKTRKELNKFQFLMSLKSF